MIDFNAWTTDFSGDAMASLMAELQMGVDKISKDLNALNPIKKEIKEIGKKLLKRGTANLLSTASKATSAATAGLVDPTDIFDDFLDSYLEEADSIKDFKSAIEKLGREHK